MRLPHVAHRPTTTASGARRCATTTATAIYGDSQDGVDPNRNYPAKRGIDEEGASQQLRQRDLPRPVRAVGAREPGGRPPAAARQVHGEHQLPLRRPAAADPGLLHDRLLPARLDAVRRHHRHRRRRGRVPVPLAALVGPLRVQRRHDRQRVHELRHHRLDAGDGHLRDDGRARRAATSSPRPDDEAKVKAVFDKNLAFALNVTNSLPNLGRPKNFDNDPSHYQIKPTAGHPAQPLRRLLRRARRSIEAIDPQGARRRPTSPSASSARTAASRSR